MNPQTYKTMLFIAVAFCYIFKDFKNNYIGESLNLTTENKSADITFGKYNDPATKNTKAVVAGVLKTQDGLFFYKYGGRIILKTKEDFEMANTNQIEEKLNYLFIPKLIKPGTFIFQIKLGCLSSDGVNHLKIDRCDKESSRFSITEDIRSIKKRQANQLKDVREDIKGLKTSLDESKKATMSTKQEVQKLLIALEPETPVKLANLIGAESDEAKENEIANENALSELIKEMIDKEKPISSSKQSSLIGGIPGIHASAQSPFIPVPNQYPAVKSTPPYPSHYNSPPLPNTPPPYQNNMPYGNPFFANPINSMPGPSQYPNGMPGTNQYLNNSQFGNTNSIFPQDHLMNGPNSQFSPDHLLSSLTQPFTPDHLVSNANPYQNNSMLNNPNLHPSNGLYNNMHLYSQHRKEQEFQKLMVLMLILYDSKESEAMLFAQLLQNGNSLFRDDPGFFNLVSILLIKKALIKKEETTPSATMLKEIQFHKMLTQLQKIERKAEMAKAIQEDKKKNPPPKPAGGLGGLFGKLAKLTPQGQAMEALS